jgi:hypothetical protein
VCVAVLFAAVRRLMLCAEEEESELQGLPGMCTGGEQPAGND